MKKTKPKCPICKKPVYDYNDSSVELKDRGVYVIGPMGEPIAVHIRHEGILDLLEGDLLNRVRSMIMEEQCEKSS